MAYIDDVFNTSGKIPTDSKFWEQSIDKFVAGDTITSGFAQVIGEQVFRPLMSPRTPFYNKFAGRVLNQGVGWTESALYKKTAQRFKPKATAEDDLKFYDSQGVQKTFTVNVQGWIPNTIPSELASIEAFLKTGSVGTLNAQLVDLVNIAYQNAIESEIQEKAINLTKNEMSVDIATNGIVESIGQIMDKASEMMSDDYHYNELTVQENQNLTTRSDKIYLFIEQKYINAYKNAKANLFNPDQLVSNVEVVPMVNQFPTPLTTAQFNNDSGSNGVKWDAGIKPVALDKPKPIAYLVGSGKIEYRPLMGSYKVNMKPNGAGDFQNIHLIYKGSVAVRPWENAIRVNLSE